MKWNKPQAAIKRTYAEAGLVLSPDQAISANWWEASSQFRPEDRPLVSYLDQLCVEGVATAHASGVVVPWNAVYALQASDDHVDSFSLLGLPLDSNFVPQIETRGALSDADFQLAVNGWWSPDKGKVSVDRVGAILSQGDQEWLMSESSWHLFGLITSYARGAAGLDFAGRLRVVGEIQAAAQACRAPLDDYLSKTDIRTPSKLRLKFKREDALGVPVIEVVPVPDGVPESFVNTFDNYDRVQSRYDLVLPDGALAHVAPAPAVMSVLDAVKNIPGRRLSRDQAAVFAHNPYAVLGDDAATAIDEDALNQARAEAGLVPTHLEFRPEDSDVSIAIVDLLDTTDASVPERLQLTTAKVQELLTAAAYSRSRGLPMFQWGGNEVALDRAAEEELAALAHWRALAAAAGLHRGASEMLDLSAYSPRVVGFDSKVQAAPYVAHRTDGKSWLPDDDIGVVTVDSQTGEVRNHPMTPESLEEFEHTLGEAVAQGRSTVRLPGSDTEISVRQASALVEGLKGIALGAGAASEPKSASNPKPDQRAGLRIHHNIESLDYVEEVQRMVDGSGRETVTPPVSLRADVTLLPHQAQGLAWLQRRYLAREAGVAGCLLADDMGLGKTLQCLALMAWSGERSGYARPSLVVAPVSLLENWKLEIEKFLDWPSGAVLSLYGAELTARRVPVGAIGADFNTRGIRKLLNDSFAHGFRLVLTTYETMRDYEFSIARQHWDIVVCDEAQKIKNPSAYVTQAAKALRADFKIACTGTPVENSLADLWCLFDFFQPGWLGALNGFTKDYRASIEARQEGHESLVERLRALIHPWVLRRMKFEVHNGLPRKLTGSDADPSAEVLPMSSAQLVAYKEALVAFHNAKELEGKERANSMLLLLHRLRMICAYPLGALRNDHEHAAIQDHLSASPKLAWVLARLDEISKLNEKVIVFTDYRVLQRLIQRAVSDQFGFRPVIVNGTTTVDASSASSRQSLIDAFQRAAGFGVLILGTTAVGFGVNIQEANHVIHFTRSWNPAKEDQATDRAYRIGQTRDVYVYCPTVVGPGFASFEQRLGERLDYKRALSSDMLSGSQELSMGDFEDL